MANISANFSLQTLEDPNTSVVGTSIGTSFTIQNYSSEDFIVTTVPANTTDQDVAFSSSSNQILAIQNLSSVAVSFMINSTSGTSLSIAANGFFVATTSTTINNLYFTNSSTSIAAKLKIFIGG